MSDPPSLNGMLRKQARYVGSENPKSRIGCVPNAASILFPHKRRSRCEMRSQVRHESVAQGETICEASQARHKYVSRVVVLHFRESWSRFVVEKNLKLTNPNLQWGGGGRPLLLFWPVPSSVRFYL